jgi:nucleoside-diphosphate-sugar epimerase
MASGEQASKTAGQRVGVRRRILLTGAAGRIGGLLIDGLAGHYELSLTDRRTPAQTRGYPFLPADIAQIEALRPLCCEIDTVVHLAADPQPRALWESLLPNNVVGVYNVFQAASEAGCRRVVFASSMYVVNGYPSDDWPLRSDVVPNPASLYGATKAWGEALGSYYAHQQGLSVLCLRLGIVMARDDRRLHIRNPLVAWALTEEDLVRLFIAAIEAPNDVRFGTFHSLSQSRQLPLDLGETRRVLRHVPQDDVSVLARKNWRGLLAHIHTGLSHKWRRALRLRRWSCQHVRGK